MPFAPKTNSFVPSSQLMGSVFVFRISIVFCAFLFLYGSVLASERPKEPEAGQIEAEEFDAIGTILHHVLDNHDWHLFDKKGADGQIHPVSIPLPIILLSEGQLDVFMSMPLSMGMHWCNEAVVHTKWMNTVILQIPMVIRCWIFRLPRT